MSDPRNVQALKRIYIRSKQTVKSQILLKDAVINKFIQYMFRSASEGEDQHEIIELMSP